MILPIHVYGSSVLRKTAAEISKDYPELPEFIQNMFETMYASDGLGLAAPQVGRSIRIFVIDAKPLAEEHPELENFKKVFINPKITDRFGEEWYYNEGCLSIPGVHEDIKRFETIKIQYFDENFEYHEDEFGGVAGRVIQHEYDHLEGIVFTDRVSGLKKRLLKNRLNGISKGKFEAKYAVNIG